jgi:hypothetical protein
MFYPQLCVCCLLLLRMQYKAQISHKRVNYYLVTICAFGHLLLLQNRERVRGLPAVGSLGTIDLVNLELGVVDRV